MGDYKPQFRPIYSFGKRSLIERMSDTFYDSFRDKSWKQVKDDYFATKSKDFKNSIDNIVNNKAANIALVVGMTTSMGANILGSHYASQQGYSLEGIEWISLLGEVALHTSVSATAFIATSRINGVSWKDTAKRLGKVAAVTTPLTFGPYAFARNGIAGSFMMNGMPPEGATPLAQLILLVPYALVVNYALKLVHYSNGKSDKKPQLTIVTDDEELKTGIEKSKNIKRVI